MKRGADHRSAPLFSCGISSAPHAWGTPEIPGGLGHQLRFSPTCVWNTMTMSPTLSPGPVQPHTHGEHSPSYRDTCPLAGSAPHAWGTLIGVAPGLVHRRFSPTRVGNTPPPPSPCARPPVQPHTRGEHCRGPLSVMYDRGSAPHAWGTHGARHVGPAGRRFSPTRVGNTLPASPLCRVSFWRSSGGPIFAGFPEARADRSSLPGARAGGCDPGRRWAGPGCWRASRGRLAAGWAARGQAGGCPVGRQLCGCRQHPMRVRRARFSGRGGPLSRTQGRRRRNLRTGSEARAYPARGAGAGGRG